MNGASATSILFRAMRAHGDYPLVGDSARALGVRTSGRDVDVHPDQNGYVHPGEGMSVAPDDPLLLAIHRRPPALLGTGRDPVWQIPQDDLPGGLKYRPTSTTHGQVEPDQSMPLGGYERALADSRTLWSLTPHD